MLTTISMRCPSCGRQTLFVTDKGGLVCSFIGCPEPIVGQAIAELQFRAKGLTSKRVHEGLKGGVHAFLGGVTLIVFAYNLAAWFARRDPDRHLAVNAVAYGLATVAEVYQARRHFKEGA